MKFHPERDTCDACGQMMLFPSGTSAWHATLCEPCWQARQRVRRELEHRITALERRQLRRMRQEPTN